MHKFSKRYSSYNEWLFDQMVDSDYKKRIMRLHNLYPDASLSQLRGHAKEKEKPLNTKQSIPLSSRSWNSLTEREKIVRRQSLDVLSDVRRNHKSLTQASKEKNISIKTVLQNTHAFKKEGNRWVAKSYDKISRSMKIYTNGKTKSIETKDSRKASLIGRYRSAVGYYRETGDATRLSKFVGKTVKDVNGNLYTFETDTEAIDEIHRGIEEPEFYDAYNL